MRTKIRFDFDNAPNALYATGCVDKALAEKIFGDEDCISFIKWPVKFAHVFGVHALFEGGPQIFYLQN